MSVTAPKLPSLAAPPLPLEVAPPPEPPPPLGTLLASRPERERRFVPLLAALLIHVFLLAVLVVLTLAPESGSFRLIPETPATREQIVTLFLPPEAPAGAATPAAPLPGAPAAPEPELPALHRVPTELPPAARPGVTRPAPTPTQPGGVTLGGARARPGAEAGGAAEGAGSTADRLHANGYDLRLWQAPGESPLDPTMSDHDRAMARIQGKLDAINDSVAALAEAAHRATDWTIKGKDGESWGITPGKLHLGKLTLPLPVSLGSMNSIQRAAAEKNQNDWAEIQRQADRASNRHTFDERVKAIRERKEKEKEQQQQKKKDSTS